MKNKVVIITGSTSGIGKALAFEYGKKGAKVVITARKQANIDLTLAELKEKGIECIGFCGDVSIEQDNIALVDFVIAAYNRIDVLINNAGISMRSLFEDLDTEVIRKVMDINFYGTLYATKYCLPHIIESKGSVLGISSIAGFRGLPARTGYSASKYAMQGFLEALRTELLYKNVNVLIVCPGFTSSNIRNTALTKDGSIQGESPRDESNMMSAEKCAELIYKASLKRKKYLIMTLQGKLTVFLNKLFPVFMDKLVYNALAKEENSPFK